MADTEIPVGPFLLVTEPLLNGSKHMKSLILATAAGLTLAAMPIVSNAACVAPASARVNTIAAMTNLLTGKTVCVPAVTQPTMDAQLFHNPLPLGTLTDYKRGPTDLVDKTADVGRWSVTGRDGRGVFVTYDYGSGKVYTYSVWNNGDGTHSFCSANPEIKARIIAGAGPC